MENELNFLETRIKALIARLSEMTLQNRRLNESLTQTLREKAELQAQNETLARSLQEKAELEALLESTAGRVESLIGRLPQAEDPQS